MVQLETKYQKTCQWPSELPTDFREIPEKKVQHITTFFGILYFGILADNRHKNIQKTTRLNMIKIIFYQQPKLPSLITKKKWWKFFCGDQLERIFVSSCSDSLPLRTGFGSRLWITLCSTLQSPEAEKDKRTKSTFPLKKIRWNSEPGECFLFFSLIFNCFSFLRQKCVIGLGLVRLG